MIRITVIISIVTVAGAVSLSDDSKQFSIIDLNGQGIGDIPYTAAFTRIPGAGDLFWWFYPSTASTPTNRPIILWLDGVTGLPPSLLANFGMFGPYDFNLNKRENSWIDSYNLLFVDAPLGTGFSTVENTTNIPKDVNENTNHLLQVLDSFYARHPLYSSSPLYIFGEGHGAQLALSLATKLTNEKYFKNELKGVLIGNGIIDPALALTKLGFYLQEFSYIDSQGRDAIEEFSKSVNTLVENDQLEEAFDLFLSLGDYVNEYAGAIAINIGRITDKLTQNSSVPEDYFGYKKYIREVSNFQNDVFQFMDEIVAPALGINGSKYDNSREAVINSFRGSFMTSAVDKVEYILQNTNLSVTIYNGNLDSVSNTPGQLEWVNNLDWNGQESFRNNHRQPFITNYLIQGYLRETERLQFYWINVAGVSAPLDSPDAMRRVLDRLVENSN